MAKKFIVCLERVILVLVLAALLLPARIARAEGELDARINIIDVEPLADEALHQVRATVSVIDRTGAPITGLTAESFSVTEDGRPAEITSVGSPEAKKAIVLVIDVSGSMQYKDSKGNMPMEGIRKAVVELVKSLSPDDELALIAFSTEVKPLVDFTYDHNAIINAVNSLTPEGWTCLYDAAFRGVEKAAQRSQGRRAVIVFTDGFDERDGDKPCSAHSLQDVIDKATKENIQAPIYTVGLESKNVASGELRKLAEETGGRAAITPDSAELTKLFGAIGEQLRSQYVLVYKSRAAAGEHDLAVKVTRDSLFADSQVKSFHVVADLKPIVKVINLAPGQELREPLNVIAEVLAQCAVSAQAAVDGEPLANVVSDDRRVTIPLDVAKLSPGNHTLSIQVTDCNGLTGETQIAFVFAAKEPESASPSPSTTATKPTCAPISAKLTSPAHEAGVPKGQVTIQGEYGGDQPEPCQPTVEILVDGNIVATALPYTWDTSAHGKGAHRIKLLVTGRDGKQMSDEITVTINGRTPVTTMVMVLLLLVAAGIIVFLLLRKEHAAATPQPVDVEVVAKLTVRESLTLPPGRSFDLEAKDYRLGRAPTNDLTIGDQPISREHALFSVRGTGFAIRDLGSSYGTTVNGQRLSPNADRALNNGDEIQLGTRTTLVFEDLRPRYGNMDVTQDVGGSDADMTRDVADRDRTTDMEPPEPHSWGAQPGPIAAQRAAPSDDTEEMPPAKTPSVTSLDDTEEMPSRSIQGDVGPGDLSEPAASAEPQTPVRDSQDAARRLLGLKPVAKDEEPIGEDDATLVRKEKHLNSQ